MHRTAVKKVTLEGVLEALAQANRERPLPHLHFDLENFVRNLGAVNPGVELTLTSAATGEGEWCSWLERRRG